MLNLPARLNEKLGTFAQRKLVKGELVLLARAIADALPVPDANVDNVAQHTIAHSEKIYCVVSELNSFTFLNGETIDEVRKLVTGFSTWRQRVAYNPPGLIFQADANTVIDDMSCLQQYVDTVYLCSVADIADRATGVYGMFRELATHVTASIQSNV